uniref:FAD-binding PCMH-type domain-containing protein n=1 Tax=Strigops habroptila TaxID=2489341 RepID=A0A672VF73_STRHB
SLLCPTCSCAWDCPNPGVGHYTFVSNYANAPKHCSGFLWLIIIWFISGNLCRCTGYRPIIDSCTSFAGEPTCCQLRGTGQCCLDKEECVCTSSTGGQIHSGLCNPEEFPPMDPTQEFIFPPELMRMAQEQQRTTLVFHGKRTTWISPPSLKELLELKAKYPKAPLVVGNTSDSKKNHHGTYHPIILHPVRIPERHVVSSTNNGLVIGAACCLAQLRDILMEAVPKLPQEKTKIYQALLQHLRTPAGEQIRSMVSLGGNIVSRGSTWDLNPILSVGKSVLALASEDGERQILLNDQFLAGCENADIKAKEVIVSVLIPYDDFISAFRQAESQKNAFSIVNSGMRLLFSPGTDTTADLSILYGGIGSTTISARKSCKKLIGRYWMLLVLNEIFLPASALGGKVEYRRTLLVSFLFRFYLEVLHGLHQIYPFRYTELSQERMSALELLQSGVPQGVQIYQDVDPGQSPQDPVGRPIVHQSGVKHATGEVADIDDIRPVDGELSLAVVTSIKAHAKIISIDASEALQVPGVVDDVTARDIPGENGKDEQAYAEDKVLLSSGGVSGPLDAIKHNSYITEERKIEKGDIEKGFKSADEIIEGSSYILCFHQHLYLLETFCLFVSIATLELVASALNLQSNKIMCYVKRVGGAFGGKITKPSLCGFFYVHFRTGRPLHFAFERNMDMLITGGRHPFFGRYKVSERRYFAQLLGNSLFWGKSVIEYIVLKVDNAYNIPNLQVRGHACKTDLPFNTVTEINMYKGVNLTSFKEEFNAENLWKCWEDFLDKSDYYNQKAVVEEFNTKNYWKKKGIAIIPMKFSVGFNATYFYQAGAVIHIYIGGPVLVTRGIELGQGIHTKMLQIVSCELKIPLSYIHFCETTVPNVASVGTEINARAVQVRHLDPIQRDNPNVYLLQISEAHKQSISLSATGYFKGYVTNTNWDTQKGHAFPHFLFGVACSKVEIDCLTGAHKNIRTDIVMDVGVGLYTLEEIYFSPGGEQLTLGPDTYKIPAICDIPEQFHVYLLPNSRNSIAIYSSKVSTPNLPFASTPDAVAAAQKERGLPLDFTLNSPLTVERIHMACADVFTEMVRLFSFLS